jgi:hypothetical protein
MILLVPKVEWENLLVAGLDVSTYPGGCHYIMPALRRINSLLENVLLLDSIYFLFVRTRAAHVHGRRKEIIFCSHCSLLNASDVYVNSTPHRPKLYLPAPTCPTNALSGHATRGMNQGKARRPAKLRPDGVGQGRRLSSHETERHSTASIASHRIVFTRSPRLSSISVSYV